MNAVAGRKLVDSFAVDADAGEPTRIVGGECTRLHLDCKQVVWRILGTNLQHHGSLKDAQEALRHASIKTTGDVYVQTIGTSVLNAMNSRTMEILADWKPAILDGKVTAINGAAPKRRTAKVETQSDQLGSSLIMKQMEVLSTSHSGSQQSTKSRYKVAPKATPDAE